ncbi:MAG TPA: hypothetical protein VF510_09575 [Ktedonobacterales bacterium]
MYDNDIRLDPTVDPDWQRVQIGTPVIASDEKRLGTVREKRPDGLYVVSDDPSQEDYLVTPQDIGHISADGIHLVVNAAQAMRAQASDPGGVSAGGMAPGTMDRDVRDTNVSQPSDRNIGGVDPGAVEREDYPPR